MKKIVLLPVGVAALIFGVAGCPGFVDLCANGPCGEGGVDGQVPLDGTLPETGIPDARPDAPIPVGCETPNEPLKNPEKCLTDVFGVFVSPTGDDGGPGTKASPFKTIGKALTGSAPRIVVCEGSYTESVDVNRDVELYSGVDCAFSKVGGKAKIVAVKPDYAVGIVKPASAVRIADFEVEAVDGTAASVNSVGIVAAEVASVKLVGVSVTAKKGFDGAVGAGGATGTVSNLAAIGGTVNGYPATASTTPGGLKTCACTIGGNTTGGGGGATAGNGQDGAPPVVGFGKAGLGGVSCGAGGLGGDGSPTVAALAAPKQTTIGLLESGNWKGSAGLSGDDGKSGQGGGGGGGRDGSSAGGGGGCGGCGGSGGKGGGGAGGSIAILSNASSVTLEKCTLTAGTGGAGGAGGTGGGGGPGGNGGIGGCSGGEGGLGGGGGAGGGGAGGIAYAIVYKGTKPTRSGTTATGGTAGKGGTNGAGVTDHGPVGTSGEELEAP